MCRSRSAAFALVVLCTAALTLLAAPAAAFGATDWSPRLGYVLTTGSVRAKLAKDLHLTAAQESRLREVGWDLAAAEEAIQRRSDLIVMNGTLSLDEKRRLIASTGYNESLSAAEESATTRAAAVLGTSAGQLRTAVDAVWQADAAEHQLESNLTAMGVTAQAAAGSFRVWGSRFTDEYRTAFGVALPDKYAKFANQGNARPGYPAGIFNVSLYWDGIHRNRDNTTASRVIGARSVENVKVVDVGPWNTDDNWWNSYTDALRPRRINSAGIAGNGGLVGKPHLAIGMPEAQAAYFTSYGRPAKIPAYTKSPENYWDKPRGYGGVWSGADQFGRQVVSPAAIDLTLSVAKAIGMNRDMNGDGVIEEREYDNEWIDVTPLWEARLELRGPISLVGRPYFTGQDATVWMNVRNAGSLAGGWEAAGLWPTAGSAQAYPPNSGRFLLSPGSYQFLTFKRTIDKAGTYSWRPWARRYGVWTPISGNTLTFSVAQRTVGRIEGADRYGTAVNISKAAYATTAPAVVIATGLDYPDALAGAPLARALGGPLLLTAQSYLPVVVRNELLRLKPTRAIILGGTDTVSENAEHEVAAFMPPGAKIERIAGHDRYDTAFGVAKALAATTGGKAAGGTAVVATGRSFPDALAGSALAATQKWPVLLVEPTRVPTETAAAISTLVVTRTVLLGSTKSVNATVAGKLPSVTRIAGADRYETAAKVADYAESGKYASWRYVGLATGRSFPDAVAGAPLAALRGGVLVLTPPTGLPATLRTRFAAHRAVTATVHAYGSAEVVPTPVLTAVKAALR